MYIKYMEIQAEIDKLEAKKKDLRADIEAQLPEDGYKDDSINVFWTSRKTWTYSPKVDALSEKVKEASSSLKELKTIEENMKVATFVEKKGLTIKIA